MQLPLLVGVEFCSWLLAQASAESRAKAMRLALAIMVLNCEGPLERGGFGLAERMLQIEIVNVLE